MRGDYLCEPGLVIYHRYLRICDNDLCASILLHEFVEQFRIEYDLAQMERRDFEHWEYCYTGLATMLFHLFPLEVTQKAVFHLIEKGYIEAWWKDDEHRLFIIHVNEETIQTASEPYLAEVRATRAVSWQQSVAESTERREASRQEPRLEEKYQREAARVAYQLNRALVLELPATLTLKQWIATLDYFEWKCAYCRGKYMLLEHFVPLNLDGGTVHTNCVPSCRKCNGKKGPCHPLLLPPELHMAEAIQAIQSYFIAIEEGERHEPIS